MSRAPRQQAGTGARAEPPGAGLLPRDRADRPGAPRITLLTRPGCHLCDEARAVIARVAADVGAAWQERDINQSEADLREYWDKIPVTFVDGVQHDFWRVDEQRLRAALLR